MQLIGNTGVPCTTQTASDIAAQNWGLFAFCDPCASNTGQKPFWSIALTLDADIIFGGQRRTPTTWESGIYAEGAEALGIR